MNATQMREALRGHWNPEQYLALEEVGQDSMRQGRRIDMLIVSIWKSRGHYLDAVEIKVSVSDWKAELKNPAKADWWWEHTNRFWLAVPAALVPKVRDDVPETWGLLSVGDDGKVRTIVSAPTRPKCTPLPWTAVVGAMRGAGDAGLNALRQAEARGRESGRKAGLESAEKRDGSAFYKKQAEEANERLAKFCEAAGIKPEDIRFDPNRSGELWKLMNDFKTNPLGKAKALENSAAVLEQIVASVRALAAGLTGAS